MHKARVDHGWLYAACKTGGLIYCVRNWKDVTCSVCLKERQREPKPKRALRERRRK